MSIKLTSPFPCEDGLDNIVIWVTIDKVQVCIHEIDIPSCIGNAEGGGDSNISTVLPLPRRVCFWLQLFVYLSVCLSVLVIKNSKINENILVIFMWMGPGSTK